MFKKPSPRHAGGILSTGPSSTPFFVEPPFPKISGKRIIATIGHLRRRCDLLQITIERLIPVFREYVRQSQNSVDLLVVGGLALQAYGFQDRVTIDVDGEIVGDLDALLGYLQDQHIPADLGENISRWAIIAMPPGYRERATVWHEESGFRLRLLHPLDFIVAKLRRGTDLDLHDAELVARKFHVHVSDVKASAQSAVAASPKDTALFLFQKTVEAFCQRLSSPE